MKRLIAALLLTATPALAFDVTAMSDAERAAFGEAVREYLMANPEVLIESIDAERAAFGEAVREYLMANPEVLIESINVLEERRAVSEAENDLALVAANRDAILDDGHSWVGGNPDGDVTMVEFVDYRCGYCKRFNDQIHDTVESDGNVRFILKEFPILGPDSETASRFAVAVHQIAGGDAYLKAHHALMDLRGAPSPEALGNIAGEIGVDAAEVMNTMNTESVSAVLRENRQLAERMGIMGTPTFVIGDTLLRGMPADGLEPAIADARKGKG